MAGCVKTIQINLGVIEVVELLASYAKIHGATKIRILFFSQSTVGYNPEKKTGTQKNFTQRLAFREG
jgi:hypothetical protein